MLKILHVANFNQFKYGAWFMNYDAKLSTGFNQLGHYVYNFSQRDVARSESFFKSKKLGRNNMLLALLETVSNLKPDLVVLGHSELIDTNTIHEVKRLVPNAVFVMWYCDALFKAHADARGAEILNEKSPYLDAVFTTTGLTYMQDVINSECRMAHIPNLVHSAVESGQAFNINSYDCDLMFAGNDYNEPHRAELLKSLVSSSDKLTFKLFQALGNPRIHGQDYYSAITNSLMGLSLSRRIDVPWYTSDRLQQIMGNGAAALAPRTDGLTTLFKEDELIWFDDESEILEKATWYSQHESETKKIAERGWKAVHKRCSADRIAQFMLDVSINGKLSYDYEWSDQVFWGAGGQV